MVNMTAFSVFLALVLGVIVLGLGAARWRRGDLNVLHEWGLAGSRLGTVVTWFLLGGELYSAYVLIAVPGAVFGLGALGFYSVGGFILAYPIAFLVWPRFWSIAKARGYVTAGDFVRGRFGSDALAASVAVSGILAMMASIAVQMYGIELCIAQMGLNPQVALVIAFLALAAFTFVSGLRAPALIAMVKDTLIWILVLTCVIYIPLRLGGFGHIFTAAQNAFAAQRHQNPGGPSPNILLAGPQYVAFATLALGIAVSLPFGPQGITGVLGASSRKAIQRNAALLPAYSIMLGLMALLGYMALAAGIKPDPFYKTNIAVPALIVRMFPGWFEGVAFAAIVIGALVPASIMSIGAANLFTRNLYRQYLRPTCSPREEATTAKTFSLFVKVGALAFILTPGLTTYVISLTALAVVWIIQTLPAVLIGLYTCWFHRWALLAGWAAGMVTGTWMMASQGYKLTYPLALGSGTAPMLVYPGIAALVVNLVVSVALTLVLSIVRLPRGQDHTAPSDYEAAVLQRAVLP
jgi:SSS family solute:Na+ symporter